MCEDVIRQAIDVESAERLLLLADRYSGMLFVATFIEILSILFLAKQLLKAALKFVSEHYNEVAQQSHSTLDVLPQHLKDQLKVSK